jgi:AraC-like DNA-binding protein
MRSSEILPPDPLSQILALLEVRGFLSRRLEASGSWALRFPDYRYMKFGGIIEGTRWLWIEGVGKPVELQAGDFYLLSHGGPYCFASTLDAEPTDGGAFMREHMQADGVIRFAGGEARTVGVGGRFDLDPETSDLLLPLLPPLIHIRNDLPEARALKSVLELLTFETEMARPGSAAISSGLCSLVLVNILRAHLATAERPPGWLGGLKDRRVGGALAAMHGDIARRWSVGELAGETGMSRTAFAERFKELVGMAPFEYMTNWRMMVARNMLKHQTCPLASIAEAIGYQSETAFSLAFKRRFGCSPGRYRQAPAPDHT